MISDMSSPGLSFQSISCYLMFSRSAQAAVPQFRVFNFDSQPLLQHHTKIDHIGLYELLLCDCGQIAECILQP